jgi:hypothetical protein
MLKVCAFVPEEKRGDAQTQTHVRISASASAVIVTSYSSARFTKSRKVSGGGASYSEIEVD